MRRYRLEIGGRAFVVDVEELSQEQYQVVVEGQVFDVRLSADEELAEALISPAMLPQAPALDAPPPPRPLARPPASAAAPRPPAPRPSARPDRHSITAPLPGVILSVEVAPGAEVSRGQPVVVLEAMKMKNIIRASRAGIVAEVLVQAGQTVAHGDVLVRLGEGQP